MYGYRRLLSEISNRRLKTETLSLPEGKYYHVFFIYRTVSPDKDWVKYIASRLEDSQPGFKCAYHERDFIPGKYIIQNFTDILRQTLKVVIVLSPEFLKSEWTKYETDIASMLSIESQGQLMVIPVLLQDCNIPDQLKHLTFLEISESEDNWLPRFLKVVSFPSDGKAVSSGSGISDQYSTLRLQRFQARSKADEYPSWAICVGFTTFGDIIITDMRNNKLKLFSFNGKLISEIKFKSRPHSFAYLDNKNFIVTFPEETNARIFTLTDKRFCLQNSIHVPFQCAGVARIDEDTFALACRSKNSLIIMNRSGKEIFSFSPALDTNELSCNTEKTGPQDSDEEFDSVSKSSLQNLNKGQKDFEFLNLQRARSRKNKSLFIFPNFVHALGKEKLFLTDYETKQLTIVFNDNGKYTYKTVCLTDPRGMITFGKYLFVADSSIRKFSLDGESLNDFPLHGGNVSCPRCFAIDSTSRYLALTHKGDGDDCITVYQILPSVKSSERDDIKVKYIYSPGRDSVSMLQEFLSLPFIITYFLLFSCLLLSGVLDQF